MGLIFLIALGIFLVGKAIYDGLTTNRKAFTKEELEAMHKAVIGKSKKEADKIQKSFRK